jgi:hypothetical protein
MLRFAPVAEGLSIDDHLMLRIYRSDAVVALNDTFAARHLRTLVVGDVALHWLPTHPKPLVVTLKECSDPLRVLFEVFDCLLFSLPLIRFRRLIIFVAMALNQLLYRLFDPLRLLL